MSKTCQPSHRRASYEAGFSLPELSVGILLVAIMMLVLYSTYSAVKTSNQVQTETDALNSLIANAESYRNNGSFGSVGTLVPIMIRANSIPGGIARSSASTIVNQWGNNISITGQNNLLTVVDSQVPSNVCQKIVSSVGNSDSNMTVEVAGATLTRQNGSLLTSDVANACQSTSAQDLTFITGNNN